MNLINTLPATLAAGLLLTLALLMNNLAGNAALNVEPEPGSSAALVISTAA